MMNKFKKEEILFITARGAELTNPIRESGYGLMRPYKGKTIIGRVLREISFRLGIAESMWYNRIEGHPKYIIIQDTLITKKYINWLQTVIPDIKKAFIYFNLVGKAKHLFPEEISDNIRCITYDAGDAEKYNMGLTHSGAFFSAFIGVPQEKEFDVFYVGRDKGRGEYLLNLESQFKEMGLKTKFIITKDGRLSKSKKYYSKNISYKEVINFDNKSKSLLNIVLPGQVGATMRDYEALFNNVKLITNNTNIDKCDFYKKENVFILGRDDLKSLKEFIDAPFVSVSQEVLEANLFDGYVEELVDILASERTGYSAVCEER